MTSDITSSLADRLESAHVGESQIGRPVATPEAGSANGSSNGLANGSSGRKILPRNLPKLPSVGNRGAPTGPSSVWGAIAEDHPSRTPAPLQSRKSERISLPNVPNDARGRVISEVQRKTGAAVETSSSSSGLTTFLIRGSTTEVAAAKQLIEASLGPRSDASINIPTSYVPVLIGPKGQHLNAIVAATQTKIDVGQEVTSSSEFPDWDYSTVAVSISGALNAVELAQRKIQELLGAKAGAVSVKRAPVNPELVAFLDQFVANLPADETAGAKLSVSKAGEVSASGPLAKIQPIMSAIDEHQRELASTLVYAPLKHNLAKTRLPSDILFKDFGVVVSGSQLYGKKENLDKAAEEIRRHLDSLHVANLDISRSHGGNADHAKRLMAFLDHAGTLREIEADLDVTIAEVPSPAGSVLPRQFSVTGFSDQAVNGARRQIISAVDRMPPAFVLTTVPFKTDIGQQQAKFAMNRHGDKSSIIHIFSPEESAFFYVGEIDGFAPSQEEVSEAFFDLQAALQNAIETETSAIRLPVDIPAGSQKFLREPLGSTKPVWKSLTFEESGLPIVNVSFGGNRVYLEGRESDVRRAEEQIPKIIDGSKDYHARSNYTEKHSFEPRFLPYLIGKNGSVVNKLKDDFQVKVDVSDDGSVQFKGLESQVKKAAAVARELEAKLKDETEAKIDIDSKYHYLLVGSKGKSVQRLREKYGVLIHIPNADDIDGQETIIIKGPSKGVAQARKEMLDLVEYEEAHSHVQTMSVPSKFMHRVIGRQGAVINSIRDATSASIDVSPSDSEATTVTVKGSKPNVDKAVKRIQAIVDELVDVVEKTIEIDAKHRRLLIGAGSETKRNIIAKAGGSESTFLQVPPTESGVVSVRLEGPSKVVAAMEQDILRIIDEQDKFDKSAQTMIVPTDAVGSLIGPGGSTLREIQNMFSVVIDVPKSRNNRDAVVGVTIRSSLAENIEMAKDHIKSILPAEKYVIKVPKAAQDDILNLSGLAKSLEDSFGVRLKTPKIKAPRSAPAPIETPAIPEGEQAVFQTLPLNHDVADGETVEWSLLGSDKTSVDAAAQHIRKAVQAVEAFDTMGLLYVARPSLFARVVGPAGTTVGSIRKKSNCVVTLPKQGGSGDSSPGIFKGTKKNVELAQKLAMGALSRA